MGGSSSKNTQKAPEPAADGSFGRLYRVSGAQDGPGIKYPASEAARAKQKADLERKSAGNGGWLKPSFMQKE